MKKPVLDAMEVLNDIRAGLDDVDLMEKYNLSARGLQSLFKKLAGMGFLDQDTMNVALPPRESVPPDQIKQVSAKQFLIDFRAGTTDNELMRKYGLSSRELENLFGKLLDAGLVTERELEELSEEHEVDRTVDVREDLLPQGFPVGGAQKSVAPDKTPAGSMPTGRRPDVLPKDELKKIPELEIVRPGGSVPEQKDEPEQVKTPASSDAPWRCPMCGSPQDEKKSICPVCGFDTSTSLELARFEDPPPEPAATPSIAPPPEQPGNAVDAPKAESATEAPVESPAEPDRKSAEESAPQAATAPVEKPPPEKTEEPVKTSAESSTKPLSAKEAAPAEKTPEEPSDDEAVKTPSDSAAQSTSAPSEESTAEKPVTESLEQPSTAVPAAGSTPQREEASKERPLDEITNVIDDPLEKTGATEELEVLSEEEAPRLDFEAPSEEAQPSSEQPSEPASTKEPAATQEAQAAKNLETMLAEPTEPPQAEASSANDSEAPESVEDRPDPEKTTAKKSNLKTTLKKLEDSPQLSVPVSKPQPAKAPDQQPRRRIILEKQREMRSRASTSAVEIEGQTDHLKRELYGNLLQTAKLLKLIGIGQLPIVLLTCALGVVSAVYSPIGFTFSSWITVLSLAALISVGIFILFQAAAEVIALAVDLWAEIHTGKELLRKLSETMEEDKDT